MAGRGPWDFETSKQSKVWPKWPKKTKQSSKQSPVPANQSKAKKALKKAKQSKAQQTKAKQSQHFPLVKAIGLSPSPQAGGCAAAAHHTSRVDVGPDVLFGFRVTQEDC